MFSLSFSDEVVCGVSESVYEEAEEVGVDVAEALELLSCNDIKIREDKVGTCKFCTSVDLKVKKSHEDEERISILSMLQGAFRRRSKSKSVSQSSSGVFSDSRRSNLLEKHRNLSARGRGRIGLKYDLTLGDLKVGKSFAATDRYARINREFYSQLKCYKSDKVPIVCQNLLHRSDAILFSSRARICFPNSAEYRKAVIGLTTCRLTVLEDNQLRCAIFLDDIDHVAIDEFLEICCITLKNKSILTMLYFEDGQVSKLVLLLEYLRRIRLRTTFKNFIKNVDFSSTLSSSQTWCFFRVINSVEIDSISDCGTAFPVCGNPFPVLESDLMYLEVDDVLDVAEDRGSWKSGHFLLKLNSLYLFSSPTPDPSKDLPDKFWVLNDVGNSKTVFLSERSDSERPNSISLQFSWVTLCLSVSNSREVELWMKELKKASEFKESDMDAHKSSKTGVCVDTVCFAIDEDHVIAFTFYPDKCGDIFRLNIAEIVDIQRVSKTKAKLKSRQGHIWKVYFKSPQHSEEFHNILTHLMNTNLYYLKSNTDITLSE